MPSEEALAILLRAVGVPAECVPTDPGERAGLYRSTLAAKKMLILLDNAQSVEQVRPLLPASPDSLVLVTSRDAFTGLIARDGARRLMLDCLEPAHACTLVEAILGRDRVKTEPSAVQELAEACGFLPMALRIAAAHLVTEPQQTIASYVAQLNGGERAANLTIEGDPRSDLEAVFDHSYQTLPQSAQHMLRLLGLLSSTSFTIEAAGVLADVDFGESTEAVQRLVQANLVRDLGSGRFTLHNLIAAYAAARCRTSDPDHARRAARSRLLDWHVTRGLDPREG